MKGINIGFIKADVEGYELELLEGTKESIKRCRPLLAICIYHQSADLYKIPLLLKNLNRDYKIDIFHHYYNYNETVLYAY
ncbi:MAG: FkbM family methyltransferase [Lachnospiraceae bacterium]|nr:FkbM family methyltransferase [Lachnospiraceae bacterium]